MIRRLMCLLHMCSGTIESDMLGIWWQCATCGRRSDFTWFKHWRRK